MCRSCEVPGSSPGSCGEGRRPPLNYAQFTVQQGGGRLAPPLRRCPDRLRLRAEAGCRIARLWLESLRLLQPEVPSFLSWRPPVVLLLAPQPRGRAGAHSPFLISVSVTPPLPEDITGRVAFEGLFWGMRGGCQICILFNFFRGQQLNSCFRCLEWASAFLQRDIGDPLVIASALFTVTGHLHQALAFPGICMTVRDQEAVQISGLGCA